MPDGVPTPTDTTADAHQVTPDEARLLRRVRLQLTLWSGGITLALLVALGIALYLAVDRTLATSGTAELVAQANAITGTRPDPNSDLPTGGFIFGGPGSGLFTMVARRAGFADRRPVGPGSRIPPGSSRGVDRRRARDGVRDIREAALARCSRARPTRWGSRSRDGTPVRVLTDPVMFRGRQLFLQVVGDRTAEERTLRVLRPRPHRRRGDRAAGRVGRRRGLRDPGARADPSLARRSARGACAASASSRPTPRTSCARR